MASWMVRRGDKKFGPLSTEVLKEKAGAGQLMPSDLVKQVGHLEWRAAANIRGLFSGEVVQQAAAAHHARNDEKISGTAVASSVTTPRATSVSPEALPPNSPAPPPFRIPARVPRINSKRKWILVSSSLGGLLLVTSIVLVISFLMHSRENGDTDRQPVDENISYAADETSKHENGVPAILPKSPSNTDSNGLASIVGQLHTNMSGGYTEPNLFLGLNTKSCYEDDSFYLVNSRAAGAALAAEHITQGVNPGVSRIAQVQENLEMLLGDHGFLKAEATVEFIEPIRISSENSTEITFTASVKINKITETVPGNGAIIRYCVEKFESLQPVKYSAELKPAFKEGVFYIDSHQVNGPLNEDAIKEVIKRNVAILISLPLTEYAKEGLLEAIN